MTDIKKRTDGRYASNVYLGRDAEGKRKYKTFYGKTPKEVERKVLAYKRSLEKGLDGSEMTFTDAANLLLESRKATMTENDYNTLEFRLSVFNDELSNEFISQIQKRQIEPILSRLAVSNPTTGKPSAQRTVQRYLSACSAVFENAIENRLIDFNPCRYCSVPKGLKKEERRALTSEERRWIEETDHRMQTAAMLMIYSGLRKGEATCLRWSDVNLEDATITVNKSYDFNSQRIKKPKTEAGVRVVNIPQKLVDYLRGQNKKGDYVVHNSEGKMLTKMSWQAGWRSLLLTLDEKYGEGEKSKRHAPTEHTITIEPFSPHECRHTFCTLMYLAGVDILTAQQQMGHSDVRTTLAIYSHLDAVFKKKSISKLDKLLNDASQDASQTG